MQSLVLFLITLRLVRQSLGLCLVIFIFVGSLFRQLVTFFVPHLSAVSFDPLEFGGHRPFPQ